MAAFHPRLQELPAEFGLGHDPHANLVGYDDERGLQPFEAPGEVRHALQRLPVEVLLPDGSVVHGTVVGVDADGALVLDRDGRRLRFVTGEVSLRRAKR